MEPWKTLVRWGMQPKRGAGWGKRSCCWIYLNRGALGCFVDAHRQRKRRTSEQHRIHNGVYCKPEPVLYREQPLGPAGGDPAHGTGLASPSLQTRARPRLPPRFPRWWTHAQSAYRTFFSWLSSSLLLPVLCFQRKARLWATYQRIWLIRHPQTHVYLFKSASCYVTWQLPSPCVSPADKYL